MVRLRNPGALHYRAFLWRGFPLAVALCLATPWLSARPMAADSAAGPMAMILPVGNADDHMLSSQCAGCHATEAGLSHPVKVAPTMPVPADWPLEDSRINCTTCHADTFGAHAQINGPLLRDGGTGGPVFCASCHLPTSNTRQSQHPLAIARAHLLPAGGVTVSTDTGSSVPGDGVNTCLACHDGAVAPDAYGGLGAGVGVAGASSHPVGVAYPSATLRRGDASFKATPVIDRRVRMTGGQVTCNACHSLYSPLRGLMVMPNDRSVLCLNCHVR
jgi:hypothetical protein